MGGMVDLIILLIGMDLNVWTMDDVMVIVSLTRRFYRDYRFKLLFLVTTITTT